MENIQINKVIALDPIDKYEQLLEDSCQNGKPIPFDKLMELSSSMNVEQLQQLLPILVGLSKHYARLWHFSFTKAHFEQVSQLRKIKEMAKDDTLWPELG